MLYSKKRRGKIMACLQDISSSVKQVAEAISIALGVEVEIVNDQLTIIAGTGIYAEKIGQKEEAGKLDGNYLYARVLRSGKTQCIDDVLKEEHYGGTYNEQIHSGELAEICTPIRNGREVIGIIGLVAYNEEQKSILLDKNRSMVTFVEKMADLLAAKAQTRELLSVAEMTHKEMMAVFEAAHEGIIACDRGGYIRHCNAHGAELFNESQKRIVGSHLNEYMISSPALDVMKSGKGYTEKEEIYRNKKGKLHLIVTAKPFSFSGEQGGVIICFRHIEEAQRLAYQLNRAKGKHTFDDIVGTSPAIMQVKNQLLITARGNSTVLISGESGTGKEMFARAIHYSGSRKNNPFVTVNCGAIPENLLESELFGYEKGAFTGANEGGKKGKFELANGGTIFLDEIGDMAMHLQVKILHVLQNMRFERVGGTQETTIDVRVIAATNRSLETMIQEGTFREDLYYRLSVIPVEMPPLRERKEDIGHFIDYFLHKYNDYIGRDIKGLTSEARDLFYAYRWPGNVRELENAIEYAVNMAQGKMITTIDLPKKLSEKSPMEEVKPGQTLADKVKAYEEYVIKEKLDEHGTDGHGKAKVAKELGLSRATLYRKLSEFENKS